MKISIFWFRRDIRIEDNIALYHSLKSEYAVLPIFIFDDDIINELHKDDPRINFIYQELEKNNVHLNSKSSSIRIFKSSYKDAWKSLVDEFDIREVCFNEGYEPSAIKRDQWVYSFLELLDIKVHSFKDHVVFEPGYIKKDDGLPYTVYTPFKKRWLKHFESNKPEIFPQPNFENLFKIRFDYPRI